MEVGVDERIVFAVGAAATLAGGPEQSLIGRSWREFVDPGDHDLIEALFLCAQSGARLGPVSARLAEPGGGGRGFAIRVCRLPENRGAVSCALTRAAPPFVGGAEGGLHDLQSFEAAGKRLIEAAQATGEQLELAFVELAGLESLVQGLPQATRSAVQTRLAGALRAQSAGGGAAARLGAERYAVIRGADGNPEALGANVMRLIGLVAETEGLTVSARSMALTGEVSPSQLARSMRYALEDFLRDGSAGGPPLSVQDALNRSVRRTLERANALGSAVAERSFTLAYQPVVWLKTGALHHYEALVRFGDDASPFPMIRMAEELDLIEGLDLAVVEKAVSTLAADPKLRLAVNVSGRTITSPAFPTCVETLVGDKPAIRDRLIFEITESAAIEDLSVADRHIQVLRRLGCMVCLDDFGAGAASLAYLQQLSLDVVKIDGRYIRELQHGGRQSTFIRHLVGMCAELGVKTLAEMVESAEVEEAVRQAGVDFGQGYLYGAPSATPASPPSRTAPVAARRRGVVESWG